MLDGTDVSSGNECVKWKRQAEVRVMTPFPILYFLPQSAIISSCRHTQNHVHCEWSHSVNGKIPTYSSSPYSSVGTCDCSVSNYPDDICCGFAYKGLCISDRPGILARIHGWLYHRVKSFNLPQPPVRHVCVCLSGYSDCGGLNNSPPPPP